MPLRLCIIMLIRDCRQLASLGIQKIIESILKAIADTNCIRKSRKMLITWDHRLSIKKMIHWKSKVYCKTSLQINKSAKICSRKWLRVHSLVDCIKWTNFIGKIIIVEINGVSNQLLQTLTLCHQHQESKAFQVEFPKPLAVIILAWDTRV